MTSRSTRRVSMLVAIALLTTVALLVKTAAERWLATPVDAGPLQLRLLDNPGVSFSLGATLPPWLVAALGVTITAAILGYAWRAGWKQPAAMRWAVTAIAAGAAANLLDRLPDGAVTDYLHTGWFPTFNLPDALITAGAALLAITIGRQGTAGWTPATPKERTTR